MSKKVERVKTEVSLDALIGSFMRAWQTLLNKTPSKEQLAMFISQNSIETGHRKSMYNYNIGNLVHSSDNFNYFENMDHRAGVPYLSKFRSYNSLDEGVLDYLKLLYKGYPASFNVASTGNPKEYAHSLIANPKHQYYDPTVEKEYASGMTSIYKKYMTSNDFNQYYNKHISNTKLEYDKPTSNVEKDTSNLSELISNYLQQIAASQKKNNKLYKQFLPNNNIIVQVSAFDYTTSIEFSRILCAALEEELFAKAYTHTNGNQVEIECNIVGSQDVCFETVKQLTSSVLESFQQATNKLGEVNVKTGFVMNKKSSYQEISFETATLQYRKFLLKFI